MIVRSSKFLIRINRRNLLLRNTQRSFAANAATQDETTGTASQPPLLSARNKLLNPFTSLGLLTSALAKESIVQESLVQLPEIRDTLHATHDTSTLGETEHFHRAIDIFASMAPGGIEHTTLLCLLIESYLYKGDYSHALEALQQLEQQPLAIDHHGYLPLVRSKLLWLQGDFTAAREICDSSLEHHGGEMAPIEVAAFRTGLAASRLLQAESIDDIFSVKDPFRTTVMQLEGGGAHPLVLAGAHLNMGIAEAVYAKLLQRERDEAVPLDGAMRSWKAGLTVLKRRSCGMGRYLKATLQANMACGLLQMPAELDHVKQASEFASDSLKTLDELKLDGYDFSSALGRTLGIVAQCYHKSGGAVTAEGLFQSAVDAARSGNSSLDRLVYRDVMSEYGDLCNDWEKREADGKRWLQKAEEIESSLGPWSSKPGICSSMWFWLPNQVERRDRYQTPTHA